jgi:hypothetical protein
MSMQVRKRQLLARQIITRIAASTDFGVGGYR